MNCNKCNTSVFERPLQRVNEKGVDGVWWCEPCLKKHNPELLEQLNQQQTAVEKAIIETAYPKKKK